MLDLDSWEEPCPKCNGLARIENPAWTEFWVKHEEIKDWFRTTETEEQLKIAEQIAKDQPVEPIFFMCRYCHGRGNILTKNGEKIVRFMKFWLNSSF